MLPVCPRQGVVGKGVEGMVGPSARELMGRAEGMVRLTVTGIIVAMMGSELPWDAFVKGGRCEFSNSGKLWCVFLFLYHAGGIIIR